MGWEGHRTPTNPVPDVTAGGTIEVACKGDNETAHFRRKVTRTARASHKRLTGAITVSGPGQQASASAWNTASPLSDSEICRQATNCREQHAHKEE